MATGGYLCIGFIAVLATLSNETKRERTADVFGYTSVGMTCVMYLPQIYITWLAKVSITKLIDRLRSTSTDNL